MTETAAKEFIKAYLCTKKSAVYFKHDSDFLTFQKAYVEIINANHLTNLVRCTTRLEDILTYTDFKETILKRLKELLHPGIEKTTKWLREKYYFPDYQKLIQNIVNECEICNIAKTEHRNTKLTFELTPEI